MRILLFCPLNPNPPKLWRRTMESILKLQWDEPLDYLLSANDNPFEKPYENITYQYNKAALTAINGGYDYLLTVESDMIIPPDALKRLVALDAGVAYGLYVHRHSRHTWSAYTSLKSNEGHSISLDPDAARSAWGKVMDVAGVGLGCTLISKNTLKRVPPFRLFSDAPDKVSCDWAFAFDCAIQGITQRCDLGVVCGHQSYKPYPMILWPDIESPSLYRREALPGVEMTPIQPGDTFKVGMGELMLAKVPNETVSERDHALLPASEHAESQPKQSKRANRSGLRASPVS